MEAPVDIRPGLVASALRRRWRIIASCAVLGVLLGLAASAVQPLTYSSTAAVFLNPLDGNPYSSTTSTVRNDQLASLETEAALVTTDVVARSAIERAKGALPEDAATAVSVTVPSNSQVLQITYQGTSARQARTGAQSFADAYLAHRQSLARGFGKAQVARLSSQVKDTTADLDRATKRLSAAPRGSAAELLSQQQVQVFAAQLSQLRIELSQVTSASVDPGDVITPADTPAGPDGLSGRLLLLGGLCAGLLLGLVLAIAREHSDDRLAGPEDVEELGAGYAIGMLPRLDAAADRAETDEAVRVLRTAVLAAAPDGPFSLTIAASAPGAAAGLAVALPLARSLARTGRRVVMVAARGSGTAALDGLHGPGLSELLRAGGVDDALLSSSLFAVEPHLALIGPGTPEDADGDLLQTAALPRLMERLQAGADVVIVAAPEVTRSEGLALSVLTDATLLTATLHRTRHAQLLSALDELQYRAVQLLGIVLVRPSRWRLGRRRTPLVLSPTQAQPLGTPVPSAMATSPTPATLTPGANGTVNGSGAHAALGPQPGQQQPTSADPAADPAGQSLRSR